eukprot:1142381-Pelagomonas_calceolata.AAC.5
MINLHSIFDSPNFGTHIASWEGKLGALEGIHTHLQSLVVRDAQARVPVLRICAAGNVQGVRIREPVAKQAAGGCMALQAHRPGAPSNGPIRG